MVETTYLFILLPSFAYEGYGEPEAIFVDEDEANAEAERRNKEEPRYGPLWCVEKAPLVQN